MPPVTQHRYGAGASSSQNKQKPVDPKELEYVLSLHLPLHLC
jgi:hypothetical protein